MYFFVRSFIFSYFLCLIFGCSLEKAIDLPTGIWRAEIALQGQVLPFNFELDQPEDKTYRITVHNGEERIIIDEVLIIGDSIFANMQVYDTQIRAKIGVDQLNGYWIKNYEPDHRYPFIANHNISYRFDPNPEPPTESISGKWEVQFSEDTAISVGIFEISQEQLTGTFLTTKGDYRYLQGVQSGDQVKLSAFDGAHAFLFEANLKEDGSLQGVFYSSRAWQENWVATRNDQAQLPNSDSLTYLIEGYERLEFSFPDLNGKMVSLSDSLFHNKIIVLQIFGTWCPNCIDETKFLANWYDQNKSRGVEIIGLAYEKKTAFDYARTRVNKMINRLGVNYKFVIAGTSDKIAASKTLPMLNHVMAFPTTIFLNPSGEVQRIHTGFTGPGTGHYYQQFMDQFNTTIDKLLLEQSTLEEEMVDSLSSNGPAQL